MKILSEEPDDFDVDHARRVLISNDRVRLTAMLFNNLAIATFVTSVLGPISADVYGVNIPKTPYWWLFTVCWGATSAMIHLLARRTLGDLEV